MRLAGKSAIVTGGASGFGEGIVRRFVAEGARVVIADVNAQAAQKLADELGDATLAHGVDVSRDAEVAVLAASAQAFSGPVDIVVNNAGVGHLPQPLDALAEAEFDRVGAINMK